MASIYKRGKIWWIHYLVNGQPVQQSLRTKSEKVAHDRKKKIEALDLIGQLEETSSTPFKTFLQSFCEYIKGVRPSKSAKNDISYLRNIFGPCCPALELGSRVPKKYRKQKTDSPKIHDKVGKQFVVVKKLEQITPEIINNHIRSRLLMDKISPKTANRIRDVFNSLFVYAIEHYGYRCPDKRYKHPVEGVKRQKENAPEITWLNKDQITEQMGVLSGDFQIKAMVAVYIYAGLRREEAVWLTCKDVDLDAKMIKIRAKTIGREYWQPKTKRNRVVPISTALYEILSQYSVSDNALWYFPSPKGCRWDVDNFSQTLRGINKESGLSWSCLDFRHTFGSHLAQNNISLYKISQLMGNSPEICRKHYAALIPEQMQDVVEFGRADSSLDQVDSKNDCMEEMMQQMQEIRDILKEQKGDAKKPNLRFG